MPNDERPSWIDDAAIGRNLARLRGDMSQKELAEGMRSFGFKWSQATVWSVEKGERPLRLTEAEAVSRVTGKSSHFLTQPEPLSVVTTFGRDVRRAKEALRQAIERYDERRFQLAFSLDQLSDTYAGSPYAEDAGVAVLESAHDVIDSLYQEIDDEHAALTDPPEDAKQLDGRWIQAFLSRSRWR